MADPAYRQALSASESFGNAQSDQWRLLKQHLSLLLPEGRERLCLVRLDRLKELYGKAWDRIGDGIHKVLREEALGLLGEGGTLLRYDALAYLLICEEGAAAALVAPLEKKVRERLFGDGSTESLFEAFQVTSLQGDALRCTPLPDRAAPVPTPPNPPAPKREEKLVLGDAEFVHNPVWDVRANMVLAYQCSPTWSLGINETAGEEDLGAGFTDKRMEFGLDLETLHKAQAQVSEAMNRNAHVSILVPVHYNTLATAATAERYEEICRRDSLHWDRRLLFEVIRMPRAVSPDTLSAAIGRMAPYCAATFLRTGFDVDPAFLERLPPGAVSVGVDASKDRRPEDDIIADMEAFVERATERSVSTYILGLETVSLGVAAVCAGFDYIASAQIARSLEPWGMDDHWVKPIDLFKEFARTARTSTK